MTTCTVGRIRPLHEDMFGGPWEGDLWDEVNVCQVWVKIFERWLEEHYPLCRVYGEEIHGPASYSSFYRPGWCQPDTPRPENLPPLPVGGLWAGFEAAVDAGGHEALDALVWFVRRKASQEAKRDLPPDEFRGTLPPWMGEYPADVTVHFGQHRGKSLADLPSDHLEQLVMEWAPGRVGGVVLTAPPGPPSAAGGG